MPKSGEIMTDLEMRNLILDALSVKNEEDTPSGKNFERYDYEGCISDLRKIVEHLAIKRGIIDQVCEIVCTAWGCPAGKLFYGSGTNFCEEEANLFTEQVHLLMFQNVISAGTVRYFGDNWPYFHVTKYGLRCLQEREVLPYDVNGYMARIDEIASIDDWEKFYIKQSLVCYNAGAFEASLIMLGQAGEYLAIKLIEAMLHFLEQNESNLACDYKSKIRSRQQVSLSYKEYENYLKKLEKLEKENHEAKYPQLKKLHPSLDTPAKEVYATYLRLTRNEMAHPAQIQTDRVSCLVMLTSYIKYCETQHKYMDFYIAGDTV